jgi:hypothetical protein
MVYFFPAIVVLVGYIARLIRLKILHLYLREIFLVKWTLNIFRNKIWYEEL